MIDPKHRISARLKIVSRALLVFAMGIVLWQSLMPANGVQSITHLDKLVHFITYGVLCLLAVFSQLSRRAIWPFLGVVVFGLIIEGFQGSMGLGRTASPADALANTAGAALAVLFYKIATKTL